MPQIGRATVAVERNLPPHRLLQRDQTPTRRTRSVTLCGLQALIVEPIDLSVLRRVGATAIVRRRVARCAARCRHACIGIGPRRLSEIDLAWLGRSTSDRAGASANQSAYCNAGWSAERANGRTGRRTSRGTACRTLLR